jgi:hypothetical protein
MIKQLFSFLFQKVAPGTTTERWLRYCKKNPSAACCRIYDL